MVCASTSVLWWNKFPPDCCCQRLCPSVSFSCLLPLQEAVQDQQVSLAQAPFKLLLLPWVSDCVRFSVHPLRVESLLLTAPWLSQKQTLQAFNAKRSGGSSSWCRIPG